MTTKDRKSQYFKAQKDIAAVFAAKGGECAKLADERMIEAQRVINLPDPEFEDYVREWTED